MFTALAAQWLPVGGRETTFKQGVSLAPESIDLTHRQIVKGSMLSATMSAPLETELVQVVLEALGKSAGPCTPAELRKLLSGPYQLKAPALGELLVKQVAAGTVYCYPKGKGAAYWTRDLDEVCRRSILAALTGEPRLRKDLEKAAKAPGVDAPRIKQAFADLIAAGLLFELPGKPARLSKQPPPDLAAQARAAFLTAAATGRQDRKKIEGIVKKQVAGVKPEQLEAAFQSLLTAGELFEWPPVKGKTPTFANRAPAFADFLDKLSKPLAEVRQIAESLQSAGATREELLEQLGRMLFPATTPAASKTIEKPAEKPVATPAPKPIAHAPASVASLTPSAPKAAPSASPVPHDSGLAQAIFDRITHVDPGAAQGALVSLRDLRRSMEFQNPSKEQFDRAVLALANQGRVFLHEHDYPDSLAPDERRALVIDEKGRYYIGVMLSNS